MLAEIAVDSELVALDRPVDSDTIPLVTVESPVETDEETEPMPLAIVDRLADVAVLNDDRPVEADVLRDEIPVLAEVDSDDRPVLSEETPVLSEETPVLREETPVLSDETAVEADVLRLEIPVDAEVLSEDRPVDSDDTPVLSDEIPVLADIDSEDTPVLRLETAVDVDVDSVSIALFVAKSCDPLIASVLSCVTWPAATFVSWRSVPFAPTLTTPAGVVPAYAYVLPPTVPVEVGTAAAVTAPSPSATEFGVDAVAPRPIATAFAAVACALSPTATALCPAAFAE